MKNPEQPPRTELERSLVEGLEQFAEDLEADVEIEKKYRVRRVVREPDSPNDETGEE